MFSRTDEKHQLYDSTPFIEARKKLVLLVAFPFSGLVKLSLLK
jgi:hypothetical protein